MSLFRVVGVAGFQAALAVEVLGGLRVGLTPLTTIGAAAVAAMSFLVWAWIRRALTGRENLVLFEHVWVALFALAGYWWLVDVPVALGLDVATVALAVFLAGGRVGCLLAGCCYGDTCTVGMRYRNRSGLPPRLSGRRLFPVQLVETIGLTAIAVVGFALLGSGLGTATCWFLVSYALLRLTDEQLRGDRRPEVFGVSVASWSAILQIGAAAVLGEWWLAGTPQTRSVVVAAIATTVGIGALVALLRRTRNPLATRAHTDEAWDLVDRLASAATVDPSVVHTSVGMTVAVSLADAGLHVSLSHPEHATDAVGRALGEHTRTVNGVTHLFLPRDLLPEDQQLSPEDQQPSPEDQQPSPEDQQWSTGLSQEPVLSDRVAVDAAGPSGYFGHDAPEPRDPSSFPPPR